MCREQLYSWSVLLPLWFPGILQGCPMWRGLVLGDTGRVHGVHGTPSPIMLQLCCGNFHMTPRLNFPTVTAMWEEGQHKRGPHPDSIQSRSAPPLCPHIPFSLSVFTAALPACSSLSPSFEYSCDGLIGPTEILCNDWCSSPRGLGGERLGGATHCHLQSINTSFSGLRFKLEAVGDGDKGSTHF